jgi:large subunit ribosomal protein L20
MPRVKSGPYRRRRHNEVLKQAKGFRLARSSHYKVAHESVMHAGQHEYIGRKLRKRDLRRLWITRINAGLSQVENSPSYSVFIKLLQDANIALNRKMLSEIAVNDFEAFKSLVNQVYGK